MHLFYIALFLCFHVSGYGREDVHKDNYFLADDPIDVVIVAHPKDQGTLNDCIAGIKENCLRVRRVIVVSSERLTEQAEWFNESRFPFSKQDVSLAIAKGDKKKSEKFSQRRSHGPGWYFQQLLKLYSPFVIPGISSNVLVIDSDTIFMNHVEFLNDSFGGLFCFSHEQAKECYLKHAERLIPGYQRIYPEVYSVCHHMLFQRPILKDLFRKVEKHHQVAFWKAFCLCVDLGGKEGASEYEIYYNYALRMTNQVQLRELIWANSAHVDEKDYFKTAGYHFVSFHTYMRGKWPRAFPQTVSIFGNVQNYKL